VRHHYEAVSRLNELLGRWPPENDMASEVEKLRAEQAQAVMPLIGPLLDAWELLDNGTKGDLRIDAPNLANALDRISAAVAA